MNPSSLFKATIAGTGSYLPEKIVSNKDLEINLDTSDQWITTRTGIKERRIAGDKESASTMAFEAGKKALLSARLNPDQVDMVIVCTSTPDVLFPSTACFVQKELGAVNSAATIFLQFVLDLFLDCLLPSNILKQGVMITFSLLGVK